MFRQSELKCPRGRRPGYLVMSELARDREHDEGVEGVGVGKTLRQQEEQLQLGMKFVKRRDSSEADQD
jgi:hypothetical protein